ncbi:alanyl-tRNA editing protein [Vibrio europaeus]|uniref:alanyl-tRNA editing protein n=1 Tax=Vibrio europaeus TaxID=300876 RepID=UPI00234005F7|nr:alanyl-tRNA editing protein [Vibrio europaeus]MDC5842495.1 alanyl-tRNA editing protein [Vibrio europaeus]
MTNKVFWQDPYLTELTSRVSSVKANQVQLADTIIYAESGGQESDFATIDGIEVIKAEKRGKDIVYTLASNPNFDSSDLVNSQIDWPRRYTLMKLHFAAEVVLEVFTQSYPSITKIGAHIGQSKSRIDFLWHESLNTLLPDVLLKSQALIDSGLPIVSDFEDIERERRYWQVEGFAKVPCGGTHLKRTSEVGQIRLKRKNVGKGKERVEITLL